MRNTWAQRGTCEHSSRAGSSLRLFTWEKFHMHTLVSHWYACEISNRKKMSAGGWQLSFLPAAANRTRDCGLKRSERCERCSACHSVRGSRTSIAIISRFSEKKIWSIFRFQDTGAWAAAAAAATLFLSPFWAQIWRRGSKTCPSSCEKWRSNHSTYFWPSDSLWALLYNDP